MIQPTLADRLSRLKECSILVQPCTTGVPITIALLKHSSLVIKKNVHILHLDTEAWKVFTPKSFIALRLVTLTLENI